MSNVLVVEDSRDQAVLVTLLLEKQGHSVRVAENGNDALALLQEETFDIVVTDFRMPEMHGIELIEKSIELYPKLPIVLVTSYGSEEIAVEALQKGAASYIPKRRLKDELVDTVRSILAIGEAKKDREHVLEFLTESDHRFRLRTDVDLVSALVAYMQELIEAQCGGANEETTIVRTTVALSEALMNAVCHGNLQVDPELREREPAAYRQEIRRRQRERPYKDRLVHVHAHLCCDAATFEVRDEGRGFDAAALPDPTAPENLTKLSGRGLYLINTFMDRVEHNDAGNEIRLMKRFRAADVSTG